MEEIRIIAPRDHNKPARIEVNGVKGETCKGLTAGIEAALGSVTSDVDTQEMYEAPLETQQHLKQH